MYFPSLSDCVTVCLVDLQEESVSAEARSEAGDGGGDRGGGTTVGETEAGVVEEQLLLHQEFTLSVQS